ncbi:MAG: nucleoside-diphosphate kinase [Caldilineaceae bacterium]
MSGRLKIVAMKMIHVELAQWALRRAHKERPFFSSLIQLRSSPVVAMVLEGSNAISVVRRTVEATNPPRPSRAASAPTRPGDWPQSNPMPVTVPTPLRPRPHSGSAMI